MRKIVCLLLLLVLSYTSAFSQTRLISGRVTDETGAGVGGASVLIRGTTTGASANNDGQFTINAKTGDVLVISAVGMERKEVPVTSSSTLNIALTRESSNLSEVVVTALGIRREKKALGYAVSTVDKKDLELRPDGDVVRILNGKAPGVDILNASGMSGSGTNIIIRGVSTITGSSTPLFVVDGVPFDASTNAQAGFQFGNTTSSRFLDLDPNNIESINILKGLSATTLYGELGRNGVVLITTKGGANRKTNQKMEITASQSVFFNSVANLPDYQYSYGGGFEQSLGLAFFSNWGAKFTDPPQQVPHPYDRAALRVALPQFVGAMYDYKPYRNSVKDFFRTGVVSTSSINIASGGPNSSFNASYSYMDDEGFTPGNSLHKNNFSLGGSAKLANNFTFSGTFNYAITDFRTPPTSTSFGSNPTVSSVFGNLIYTPIAVDLIGLPWENPLDKSSIYYRGGNDIQNPFWTVNNAFARQRINRIYGQMQMRYEIMKDLNVTYRVGYDNYSDLNSYAQHKGGTVGGSQYTLGLYRTVDGHNTIWNHDAIVNWNKQLATDWNLNVDAGIQSQERIYYQNGQKSTNQLVYGLFDHDNFIVHENLSEDGSRLDFQTQTQTVGVYAQGLLGFKDYVYLTVGGRNSWSSNLEKANRSLFYPSASISFIPTSAIDALKGNKNINYLKLRAGYSTSANFGRPYATRPVLNISTNEFVNRAGTVINANSINNRLANPNLKAELLGEAEVGVEGKFINSRVSLDLTLYKRVSNDQILDRDLDPATGFTVTSINAGSVRNKGIELGLGYTAIRNRNVRWQLDGNFTLNRSLVYNLPPEIKQIVIDGFTNEGLFAINNQPLGVIQATSSKKYRNANDAKDPANGQRLVDGNGNYVTSGEIGIVGNPIPDFKLSGINTISYKNLSLRFQVDYTQGGDMLAYTPGTVVGRGLTKDTDFDRQQMLILPGVKADGTPNDVQTSASQAYFTNLSGFFGLADLITYDATVVRLREASLSYSLPDKLIGRSPFGAVQLSVTGQNLWYNAPNFPEYVNFDPETSSLGVSNVRGLEYLSGPTSRRIGVSLRVSF